MVNKNNFLLVKYALFLFIIFNIFPFHTCYAASDEATAVFVIIIFAAVFFVFAFIYSKFLESRWIELARQTGLQLMEASPFSFKFVIHGTRAGRKVRINTFSINYGSGRNRHSISCVRICVKCKTKSSVSFKLLIEGLGSKILKATGMEKEIEIGSPDFDKKFLIKGLPDQKEYIKEILDRRVQSAVKGLLGIFSPRHFLVNVTGPEIIFEYSVSSDIEFIRKVLNAAETTASSIEAVVGDKEDNQ
jgi:hypothetical protein